MPHPHLLQQQQIHNTTAIHTVITAYHTSSTQANFSGNPLVLAFSNLLTTDTSEIWFANPDIRYPDLSANFMAAENPDILK